MYGARVEPLAEAGQISPWRVGDRSRQRVDEGMGFAARLGRFMVSRVTVPVSPHLSDLLKHQACATPKPIRDNQVHALEHACI